MFNALDTASSGVTLSRVWMDATSDNVANVNTVRPAGDEPFRARLVVAQSRTVLRGVDAVAIEEQQGDPEIVYDPDNPLADPEGYVTRPKVDLSQEMTNMLMASRLFQANISVMQQARETYASALRIGSGA
ncbi:MAG: flagellar basal body rod protein FlgC [Actinomycetota bacterium]|nr:flagellar basal body rod protein FlgC [Actinomycetota bacterium]